MTDLNFAPITAVIRAITGILASPVKYQLERSKALIEIRKKWNLLPEHPPASFDFIWVYQYASAEYSGLKIKEYGDNALPLIKLFEEYEIIESFYQSFFQNDNSILFKEVNFFIESSAIGDCIRDLKFDVEKEFNEFMNIFIETANSTRTPAEVIQIQKINQLSSKLELIANVLQGASFPSWNEYLNLHSLEGLVRIEIEELIDSLGVAKPDSKYRLKIRRHQGFRLVYQIPCPSYVLLLQGIRSIWVVTCLSDYGELIRDLKTRHIQERIKFAPKGTWCVPVDTKYMREDEDLGLHKFVLLLSHKPFPESIQSIVAEEILELKPSSLELILRYIEDKSSNVEIITAECDIIS